MIEDLESKEWTGYHTYLVLFFSIMNFFGLFNIVFGGFIMDNVARSFGISVTIIPTISMISGLGLFPSIITRNLPDKFGRKKTMLVISNLVTINLFFTVLAPNVIIYTILGFVGSLLGIATANVIIAEEIPAEYRGTAIGIIQGIGMSASLLAAFLSMFVGISTDAWRYFYVILNIPAIIIFNIMIIWLREPKRYIHEKKLRKEKGEKDPGIFSIFQRKFLRVFSLSALLLFTTQFIYLTVKRYFKPFLLSERDYLGFNDALIGFWMIFIYIGSIIGYYLSGYLADRIGRKKTIYISSIIYFIFNITFVLLNSIWGIFLSLFGVNISFSIFMIAATIYSVELFPTKERSTASGWVQVIGNSAWVVTNLIISIFMNSLNLSWGSTFLILSFLPLCLIIITYFLPETKKLVVEEIVVDYLEEK